MLTCAYTSALVRFRASRHKCFHFANVACKFLTSVLEDKFGEIFKTDSGWNNLIFYCRRIHAAVFPFKRKRPPGYDPLSEASSDNNERRNEELLQPFCLGLESASNARFDGKNYWSYFKLDDQTLRERITSNNMHLKEVTNLLSDLGMDMDTEWISSDLWDIPESDDEYIEKLEKGDNWSSEITIEPEITISYEVKDCFAKEICENENTKSGSTWQNQIRPEDITHEEVIDRITNLFRKEVETENGFKCDLCDGKMQSFIENWKEKFRGDYSNSDSVTDVI